MNSPNLVAPIVTLQQVNLCIAKKRILRDISLAFFSHTITVLYGANGAGKSSFLKLLAGLQSPRHISGKINATLSNTQPGCVAYMPQQGGLYEELSVAENLRFRAAMLGLNQTRERISKLVAQHGLQAVLYSPLHLLSGGWKQRVAFALSLMAQPKLLLLDEPSAGVDLDAKERLWQQVDLAKQSGACIIICSHDTDEAERADYLISLHQGTINFQGRPQDCISSIAAHNAAYTTPRSFSDCLRALLNLDRTV